MIFIAKNADFSLNKIGQIPITYDVKTEEVLAAYANTEITVNQKDKFDTMVKGLKTNGILSKISHLYLPILAPTLDKALINIAKEALPVDAIPNSSAYALDAVNGGIYNTTPGTALNINLSASENLSDKNFHYLAFNTNIIESNSAYPAIADTSLVNISMNFTGNAEQYMAGGTRISGTNIQTLIPDSSLAALHKEQSLKGLSTTTLAGVSILSRSLVQEFTYTSPISTETLTGARTLNFSGYNSSRFLGSHGIISLGRGLSKTELELFSSLANDFMTAMGVNVYSI